MTTTITAGATTITPDLVDGYSVTRSSQSILHPIIGAAEPDVTFRPMGLRRGTLRCIFALEADAWTAYNAIAGANTSTLVSDERDIDMVFMVDGELSIELDDETRDMFIVSIDFQELT